ncbi:hypothetical protein SAMN05421809_3229 [Natronorubrum daqingense]|uniref:Uncharacterized protein n=1 Tax=Natronorubrum daqingense TaxID=588898 RepID=A0A1N7FHI4_9EURY|nr:hypothetical protein SAMN05421809_3229 [Natronorubrum daqingense]
MGCVSRKIRSSVNNCSHVKTKMDRDIKAEAKDEAEEAGGDR